MEVEEPRTLNNNASSDATQTITFDVGFLDMGGALPGLQFNATPAPTEAITYEWEVVAFNDLFESRDSVFASVLDGSEFGEALTAVVATTSVAGACAPLLALDVRFGRIKAPS